MDFLPINAKRDEIVGAVQSNKVVIVKGETGCGKTLQLPIILHEMGLSQRGTIVVAEPRRAAATSVAEYVAAESVMIATNSTVIFLIAFASLALLFGSLWTVLRALFLQIAPPEQRSMYFGIYTSVDRLASVLMPLIWGGVMILLKDAGPIRYRWATGIMIVFIGCALALIPQLRAAMAYHHTSNGNHT